MISTEEIPILDSEQEQQQRQQLALKRVMLKNINKAFRRTTKPRHLAAVLTLLFFSSGISATALIASALAPLLIEEDKKLMPTNESLAILSGIVAMLPVLILAVETGYYNYLDLLDHPVETFSLGYLSRRIKNKNINPSLFFTTEALIQTFFLADLTAISLVNYYVAHSLIKKENKLIALPDALVTLVPFASAISATSTSFSFLNQSYQRQLIEKALQKSAPLDHALRLCQVKLFDALIGKLGSKEMDNKTLIEFYVRYHAVPNFIYRNNEIIEDILPDAFYGPIFEFFWHIYQFEIFSQTLITSGELTHLLNKPEEKESWGWHLSHKALETTVALAWVVQFTQASDTANDIDSPFYLNNSLRFFLELWFGVSVVRASQLMNITMAKELMKQLSLFSHNWSRMSQLERGVAGVGGFLALISTALNILINYQFPLIDKLALEFAIIAGIGAMPLITKSAVGGLKDLAINLAARYYGWGTADTNMFALYQAAGEVPEVTNVPNNKQKLMANYTTQQINTLIQAHKQQVLTGSPDRVLEDFIFMRIREFGFRADFPESVLDYPKFYRAMEARERRVGNPPGHPGDDNNPPPPSDFPFQQVFHTTEIRSKKTEEKYEGLRRRTSDEKKEKEESTVSLIVDKLGFYAKKPNKKLVQSNINTLGLVVLLCLTELVAGKTVSGQFLQLFIVLSMLSIQAKQTEETVKGFNFTR